jgi:hypothetical protein
MESIVGIFASRMIAETAVKSLLATSVPRQSVSLLSGEAGESQLETLATTDAERDGMGGAVGGVIGGAVGASAGLSLGSAIASVLIPGVGTIFAIGLGAAALLGLGGAAAGASLGEASEHAADIGVPKDDTFLYRELLKQGRSLVIVNTDNPDFAVASKAVFQRQGTENIDEARKVMLPAA